VALAGTFNDWNPAQGALKRNGGGNWELFVSLPPGRHEYRFVVDGQWVDDPNAQEFVANTHGSCNAVVVVNP
jgi:1,4-alpha-glucan branching enzyme